MWKSKTEIEGEVLLRGAQVVINHPRSYYETIKSRVLCKDQKKNPWITDTHLWSVIHKIHNSGIQVQEPIPFYLAKKA